MQQLLDFLRTSYTAYQAVENAKALLLSRGFRELREAQAWELKEGGSYFVTRGGSALIAFTYRREGAFKIIASHTDSPCLKLKDAPVTDGAGMKKLNVETYGGGLWYTFFDRPLKIAGRVVRERGGKLVSEPVVSSFRVVIPSLAVHMNREANEKFSPNAQVDLLPLYSFAKEDLGQLTEGCAAFDLYAVPDEAPFASGADGEFISAPRVDNLTSVYASLNALCGETAETCVAACLDNEEVGSLTAQGAGGDFLANTLRRISACGKRTEEEHFRTLASSFLISLDNAHAIHPNHPEKCDITNKAALGGGVVVKGHANRAYTTDAVSAAVIRTIFRRANVRFQSFFNRSDMRSGGTLGAVSQGKVSILSVDLGLPQLAMHSAVETFAASDYAELERALAAFFRSTIAFAGDGVTVKP